MGSDGVKEPPQKRLSIPELFDQCFPEYLAMGMTYRQFWHEDCRLVVAYRKAYRIRQEEANRAAWLNGLYIYKALQCAPQFVQGFIPKGTQIEPYPDKPFDFTPRKPKTAQEKYDDEVRAESEKIKQNMMAFMRAQEAEKKQKELEDMLKDEQGKE